ncbi:hypothetical protein [Tenacibaculum finnmarkense]|uniref:hypothetical protein n=1 Tax=Tenacibaculum finnmarkense TaxID=2781243 RepID=UPI00187B1611|nr:hypothetical protein [Tenacibaculum finnmarkense]MBE7661187.1 hypothetical protein [Tenacibaculum finnmarkense genomovar finnmarkense]MCG8253230.1 hypothetical protein [Tenacibaculum finnmarkense genomovar finnmarkense]MCG8816727.1 hypothetical protein [Tenacibaculum finnmarkense]MCG8821730.1 hypothetical protein [Tenacibaculum finnmarkense]
MGMSSSRRYGMQEITMVTTSNRSDWRCTIAESQSPIKWYALGNTYRGDTPAIDFIGNTGSEKIIVKSSQGLTRFFCGRKELKGLDVSKNVNLASIFCSENQLTELDVSKNVRLDFLSLYDNDLKELDVSKNVRLDYLDCSKNPLTELDVSKNVILTGLWCRDNPNLTTIYVNAMQLANIQSNWHKPAHTQYVLKQ